MDTWKYYAFLCHRCVCVQLHCGHTLELYEYIRLESREPLKYVEIYCIVINVVTLFLPLLTQNLGVVIFLQPIFD